MLNNYKIIQKSIINEKLLTYKMERVEVPKSTLLVKN